MAGHTSSSRYRPHALWSQSLSLSFLPFYQQQRTLLHHSNSVKYARNLPLTQNIIIVHLSSRATTATMTEWTKKKYNEAYTEYMPWIEDKVLGYWGENKTSYTAKGKVSSSCPSSFPLRPRHPSRSSHAPLTPLLQQKSSIPTSPVTRMSKPFKAASLKASVGNSPAAAFSAVLEI